MHYHLSTRKYTITFRERIRLSSQVVRKDGVSLTYMPEDGGEVNP